MLADGFPVHNTNAGRARYLLRDITSEKLEVEALSFRTRERKDEEKSMKRSQTQNRDTRNARVLKMGTKISNRWNRERDKMGKWLERER